MFKGKKNYIKKYNMIIYNIYKYAYDPMYLREDFSGRYCQITYYIGKYRFQPKFEGKKYIIIII